MLGDTGASTADLQALVLGLLHCLAGALNLDLHAVANKTVLGLKLVHGLLVVVDEAEAGGLAAAKLGTEAEKSGELGVGLVHAANNLLELGLGDGGASRVDDVDNHLC